MDGSSASSETKKTKAPSDGNLRGFLASTL